MENTTNEKRYTAKVFLDELYGYCNVPMNLFKRDADIETEDIFTEKEINELKMFFESKKRVSLTINEIQPPINLREPYSYETLGDAWGKDPLGGVLYWENENNILSFELAGYYECEEGLKKDEKRVKVWIATENTPKDPRHVRIVGKGELTAKEYKAQVEECPQRTLWAGEVTDGFIDEVIKATQAESIFCKLFRFIKPVTDSTTLPADKQYNWKLGEYEYIGINNSGEEMKDVK